MKTLEKNRINETSCQVCPADLTPEHIAVAFLVQRFQQLPPESFRDIILLLEAWTNPETPEEDRCGIFETVREILFPELIGGIYRIDATPAEQTPTNVKRRAEHIGNTIQKMRDDKGWTQTELAKKSGLQQSHISRLEAGIHSPSWRTLEKIASAFEVEVGELDPSN